MRFLLLLLLCVPLAHAQTQLRVAGATLLVSPFDAASALLKNEDIDLKVYGNATTATVIQALGESDCDLAITTRPVTAAERSGFPDLKLSETIIGYQAFALTVSEDVWTGGLRSLSRAEMQRIYELKVTDWKELGKYSYPIKFFNPEKGKGIWEFFMTWLYGDMRKAPIGQNFETVDNPEETRNLVEFNSGALALLPPNRANSKGTHALAIRDEKGALIAATPANVRSGLYPIVRPVIVVTAYRPAGVYKKVIDFMLSAQGQQFVRKADLIPVLEELTE